MNYYSRPGIPYGPIKRRRKIVLPPETIISRVCEYFDMPQAMVLGTRRTVEIVNVRHAAIYFIRMKTTLSLNQIGKLFNRDHTTIIAAVRTAVAHIDTEDQYKHDIEAIEKVLNFSVSQNKLVS